MPSKQVREIFILFFLSLPFFSPYLLRLSAQQSFHLVLSHRGRYLFSSRPAMPQVPLQLRFAISLIATPLCIPL
jgi:hypothetical protein